MTSEVNYTVSSIIIIVLIRDKVGSTGGSPFKILMANMDARIEYIYCHSLAFELMVKFFEL